MVTLCQVMITGAELGGLSTSTILTVSPFHHLPLITIYCSCFISPWIQVADGMSHAINALTDISSPKPYM